MNEQYLHLIWKLKRLPFHQMRTVQDESIDVQDVGQHNLDSGPDFFNGQIILHGLRHHGNIELHVRSSDWYLHKHQQDPAYDSVILHVVYEYDQPVFVRGKELPTIELKPWIDWQHYEQFQRSQVSTSRIICAYALSSITNDIRSAQWESTGLQRLERKSRDLYPYATGEISLHHLLIRAFAGAFGAKTNRLPFRELAHNLPLEILLKASLFEKTVIIFGLAGFLDESPQDEYHHKLINEWRFQKHKLQLGSLRKETWKFKGCLPAGFPTIRLAQFIQFIHQYPWHEEVWLKPVSEQISIIRGALQHPLVSYWLEHYDFGKMRKTSKGMSRGSINGILINSLPLFLCLLTERFHEPLYKSKAIEMWNSLPAERNQFIDYWHKVGVVPQNAFESQALLEQLQYLCTKKRCSKCLIGQELFTTFS